MDDRDRAVARAAFEAVLSQLQITDDGLDPERNTLGAVEIVAELVDDVKRLDPDRVTPEDILVRRLAVLTGELLTTAVLPGGRQIVRDWLQARAELTELRLRCQ